MSPKLFQAKDNTSPYIFTFPVLLANVELYNQKLFELNTLLTEANASVPREWLTYDYKDSSLAAFLIDSKGKHLDPVTSLTAFQKNVVTFLLHMETIQLSTTGVAGYNARVLAQFSKHLLDLCQTLINYTHHEQTQ